MFGNTVSDILLTLYGAANLVVFVKLDISRDMFRNSISSNIPENIGNNYDQTMYIT